MAKLVREKKKGVLLKRMAKKINKDYYEVKIYGKEERGFQVLKAYLRNVVEPTDFYSEKFEMETNRLLNTHGVLISDFLADCVTIKNQKCVFDYPKDAQY